MDRRRHGDLQTRIERLVATLGIEAGDDAIVAANDDARIVLVTPSATALLRRSADELLGETISTLVPEEYRRSHERAFARFVATGEGRLMGSTIRVRALVPPGETIPIDLVLGERRDGIARIVTARMTPVLEPDERPLTASP